MVLRATFSMTVLKTETFCLLFASLLFHIVAGFVGSSTNYPERSGLGISDLSRPTCFPRSALLLAAVPGNRGHKCADDERRGASVRELEAWARSRGAQFADGVSLSRGGGGGENEDDGRGWSVRIGRDAARGSTILTVPTSLVLCSKDLPDEVEKALGKRGKRRLDSAGVSQYVLEFRLMVRLLVEWSLGDSSDWQLWISSLPTEFDTSLYWDDVERMYLSPYVGALADFQRLQFDAFCAGIRDLAEVYSPLERLLVENDEDILRWAFSVVFTRSWRSRSGLDATIVPLGDMLNHCEDTEVEVVDDVEISGSNHEDSNISVAFTLTKSIEEGSEIHLSYGPHSPANFLAVFGFVDETMTTVPSHVDIPNSQSIPELVKLGATKRRKMVYGRDGQISDAVWDCVLYTTLNGRPDEQAAFYLAAMEGNLAAKAQIHTKYALEIALSLCAHVENLLATYPDPGNPVCSEIIHPRALLLMRYNEIMRDAYNNVKDRLKGIVQTERLKRLKMISAD